ncbi:hypothetical protein ASF82_04045 [Frigoribacterium sp. Leaf164]|uniref:hypothetical protein n=1 Tax=Frigoribacterium sp. Leaf164 TaxID=1736282 RepID=UPI0006F93EA4|nr:hypothetical protein [Frigoribacterium sp. Leaf164]KQR46623.1 hypothetical protein ASF82_04045 [Frigoribacterium sp. Leaf164]
MKNKFSWRRALAVPAALTLALGGVLLTSTAASAAPGNLVIDSPAEGATTTSRTVTVTGSAVPGAVINIFSDSTRATRLVQTTTDRTSGAFTATLPTYADTVPVSQSIFVDGLVGLSGFDQPITRAFNLPAVAPAQTFSVTSPTAGQQGSRTVTFSGTGNDGSTVNVLRTDGTRLVPTALVVVNGAWSADYTYAETEAREQTVNINQVSGGAGTGAASVTFALPTGQTLVVATPVEGSTVASRTVTFSGTGTASSSVNVLDPITGERVGAQTVVGSDGTWSTTVVFADDAEVAQSVRVTQVTGASGSGDVTRSFNLPAAAVTPDAVAPAAPVITSPVPAQVVVGQDVTISGTGTPGANIAFLLYPTDEAPASSGPLEDAITDSVIVVAADGTWSSTVRMVKPGEYSVVAISFFADANGEPTLDADGFPLISEPSNVVEFRVAAATPITPAGTSATPVRAAGSLAFTGSDDSSLVIGLGAALTLAGAGLVLAARRRRAQLSTVDAQQD